MIASALLFNTILLAPFVLATPAPILKAREPNCLADIIQSRGLEVANLERRSSGWSYEGESGPAKWSELDKDYTTCQSGGYQSPINFEGEELAVTTKPSLSWSSLKTPFDVLNNGHTVQLQLGQAANPLVPQQINGVSYNVAQVHFHSPSEHHVNEHYFPLEAHFVHASADKKLSVIGVFFVVGAENLWVEQFINQIPAHKNETSKIPSLDMTPIISAFQNSTYFSYTGSLTTPPCTEGILWLVAREPLEISQVQLNELTSVMPFNSRLTQPNKSVHSAGEHEKNSTVAATVSTKATASSININSGAARFGVSSLAAAVSVAVILF
ncbi:hypothetical protein HDU98_010903 [Podochytrium sp. JEL0797]|nr:hypothetical protein HDU98_010903 [Podochytrium sp. JEL0797]